ncbi:MAG: polysaccharide deacetylase, partial [Deltaproteobacteria bacterium]
AVMEHPEKSGKETGINLDDTPFMNALSRYTGPPSGPQDHGLRNAPIGQAVFITIDLCPSQKKLDYELFRFLEVYSKGVPAPVAVALSGKWLKKHAEELKWLINEAKAERLNITWVNHSYSHPYKGGILPEEDFLLLDKNKFEEEVLLNESLMLENGITPSPFFRFPGLVADRELLARLKILGLIPIGSDAWLAKGQTPKQGSVILVHGNGNEPAGVKALFKYMGVPRDKNPRIKTLPLKAALR